MDKYIVFPDHPITPSGTVSKQFISLGVDTFHGACRHIYELPYGYNSDRDDLMILFKERGWREASLIWTGSWAAAFSVGGTVARLFAWV